jgi:hypothetical protein
MKILIATPVSGNSCTTSYTEAMVRLARTFQKFRPSIELVGPVFISTAQVQWARNVAASLVLQDSSFTHLLFVDADTAFEPKLLAKLLDFDKPFVGALYPKRPPGPLGTFVCEEDVLPGPVTDGFLQARQLGTGLLLLQRRVFEQMAARFPELLAPPSPRYRSAGVREQAFQCFESLVGEDGLYVSEDFSFSRRWREVCGGEIWVCIDEPVSHAGYELAQGRFLDKIRDDGRGE